MPTVDPADVAAAAPPALLPALQVAVTLWIPRVARWAPEARAAQAALDGEQVAGHADDMLYGGADCADTFNALARGLACAAYAPGGVSFAGLHFEVPARDCPGCGTGPPYRRRLADPWDGHDVCPECGYCYTHDNPPGGGRTVKP